MGAGLLEINDYPTALRAFQWKALWELVDGTEERLNLAHECVDRHLRDAVALRTRRPTAAARSTPSGLSRRGPRGLPIGSRARAWHAGSASPSCSSRRSLSTARSSA